MTTEQPQQELNLRGSPRLKLVGTVMTTLGLVLGVHALRTVLGLFQGLVPAFPMPVLYLEAALAVGVGIGGFALLVASAAPFDESEEAPLRKYENELFDPFEGLQD